MSDDNDIENDIEFVGLEDITRRYTEMFDYYKPPLPDDVFAYLLKVKIGGYGYTWVYRFAGDFVRSKDFANIAKDVAIRKTKRYLTEHKI